MLGKEILEWIWLLSLLMLLCVLPQKVRNRCWLFFHVAFSLFFLINESVVFSLGSLESFMLVSNLNLSIINFLLHIRDLVDNVNDTSHVSIFWFVVIEFISKFKPSFLNWLNVVKVIHDSSKYVPHLLLILILCCNNHLLIETIDSNNVTNHVLKGSL